MALSTHGAPLGPGTLKASAGAAENLPLIIVHDTSNFVRSSKENGWKFYAAVAPPGFQQGSAKMHSWTTSIVKPLEQNPCVLMFGGEGMGLQSDLRKKADHLVSIQGYRSGSGGVDSLNVSVAAGILCESFLRRSDGDSLSVDEREGRIW